MFRRNISINVFGRRLLAAGLGIAAAALSATPRTARGQIFEVNVHDGSEGTGSIGEYTTSGATMNASLISGLDYPTGIAVSGSSLFVANYYSGNSSGLGTIGEYTTSGTTVQVPLISGLNNPIGIAVSGTNIFVTNQGTDSGGGVAVNTGSIAEYTTSGVLENSSLVSGLDAPYGLAVSGGNLFVTNGYSGTIGEYTTSGATVNASLVTGLDNPGFITVCGSDLYVMENNHAVDEFTTSGTPVNDPLATGFSEGFGVGVLGTDLFVADLPNDVIDEYDVTSGAPVEVPLISGLDSPGDLVVVPEPATGSLLLITGAGILMRRRRQQSAEFKTSMTI
jgi:hypothetical protein